MKGPTVPGTSANFRYSNALWTNSNLHTGATDSQGRTERKTAAFLQPTSMVTLEMTRGSSTHSVSLPISPPRSLQQLFPA